MDLVSSEELLAQWLAERMNRKRTDGLFTEIVAHSVPARNPRFSGGDSRIVKLVTASGYHIGTLHEVVLPDGSVPHSHPKDYTRRDCSRMRVEGEPAG